ncbi:MAG: Tetratricopeptide 2 repeat protein [Hymenobacter sp.]|nr:Tetratricopeptide 2 repeat protein [Hymenobacter sp.]
MYIQKLTIENIRGLKHFEMTFPENPAGWHVIIGDNGAGKSTLIRAISLGLIGPNEVREANPNFAEWLRQDTKKGFAELVISWDAKYDTFKGLGRAKNLVAKVLLQPANPLEKLMGSPPLVEAIADEKGKLVPGKYLWGNSEKGWFSAGFGPFRRFTGGDAKYDKVYSSSPRCGAHLSVFGEDVALTEALRWLQEIDYQQLKAREKRVRQDTNRVDMDENEGFANGSESEMINEVQQLWKIASRLQKSNLFSEAESLLRQALAVAEKAAGPNHPSVSIGLNNLALLLQDTNRLAEAEQLFQRALTIDKSHFGPEHPEIATSLSNLASLLFATNRLTEAESYMRQALTLTEANLEAEHPDVAIRLNNLAVLLQNTNRFAEAEPLLRRALAITEASLGQEHPSVAIRLNNLAVQLRESNRLAEAELLFWRALAITEANLGVEHPDVAIQLNNLAVLLQDTNRRAEAEPLLRRALAITETSLGSEHPDVAIQLNNLALLLRESNRIDEAESFLRRALTITENSLGNTHPTFGLRLRNLGALLQETNKHAEAELFLRRALSIAETGLGLEHIDVAHSLSSLALLLQETNRLDEAESLLRKSLVITEAIFGTEHSSLSSSLHNLAMLLQDTGRLSEAELLLRRALAIDEARLGANHPEVTIDLNALTSLLKADNRTVEANLLIQQYERKRTAIPSQSASTVEPNKSQKIPFDENKWLAFQLRTFINESRLLPANIEFKGMSTEGPVFRDGNGQIIAVTQLSDGFRSILSLAFELIRQLIRVYGLAAVFPPDSKNGVIDLPGVVLIDEVDTHLHPTWQTRIGQWFTKCFPQIQFIVTTHTPIICRAVTDTTGSIWRLPTPGQGKQVEEVTGTEKLRLRLGNVLDAYGTGLFGGQEVEQSAEATALLTERASLSAREAAGKATPAELERLRELRQLFSSVDAEIEI